MSDLTDPGVEPKNCRAKDYVLNCYAKDNNQQSSLLHGLPSTMIAAPDPLSSTSTTLALLVSFPLTGIGLYNSRYCSP